MEAPSKIGRYEVDRLLGQGGMGRVWLARDTVLGRRVAIKVLRSDLALPPAVRDELVVRMRHEAQAAAAVSHPNIVTLYDMGEDDTVGLFLVFEYVPGPSSKDAKDDGPESLRDRLKRGALPLPEVARLAKELGSALSFAHEAGVIHRDVKPENILFSRTGAKIADFGIARIPESTITRQNTVLGTPAYTAPEALSKGDFGPLSDQFSLAATLYEAATGARAFGSDDPIATAGKVSSEPPPPMHPSLGTGPQVRALGNVLMRGLAKEATNRHASCAELGDAVARAIERPPASDAPPADVMISEKIEIERTPLSSRIALAERAVKLASEGASLTPIAGETPRPSVFIRRKTERLQNIAAGIAVLVIIGLIAFGRRQDDASRTAPSASASASNGPPPRVLKITPRPSHALVPSTVEDAGAQERDRDE
jgi:serine/threonine-protein kinase